MIYFDEVTFFTFVIQIFLFLHLSLAMTIHLWKVNSTFFWPSLHFVLWMLVSHLENFMYFIGDVRIFFFTMLLHVRVRASIGWSLRMHFHANRKKFSSFIIPFSLGQGIFLMSFYCHFIFLKLALFFLLVHREIF